MGAGTVSHKARQERLGAELESMRALKKASNILDFEISGEPPDRYLIIFRGQGLARGTSSRAETEIVQLHKVDIRLPYS